NKVAIVARRTSDPIGGPSRETVAAARAQDEAELAWTSDDGRNVRAVVGASNVIVARTTAAGLGPLLAAAARLELAVGDVVCSGEVASAHLPLLNVPDWARCAREIDRLTGGAVTLEGPYAIVSVVGYGLTGVSGALGKALAVLDGAGAAPVLLSAGPLRISATIEASKLADAERALHAAFVG
ncbi:MAG: hypothetical protein KF894_33745, partial [Labilithrix sp.]|nr:hypothetical protein [Labilithrix sp.]